MAEKEIINNSLSRGIDLAGRKMWYAPWPADDKGDYRKPSLKEIDEVYGISGGAVRETLLYFEERAAMELADVGGAAAATARLVSLLNEHAVGERYFVTREDLLDAARMLGETGDTVVRISFDAGFENLRSFNRAFKAVMGMTPSEYRKGRN